MALKNSERKWKNNKTYHPLFHSHSITRFSSFLKAFLSSETLGSSTKGSSYKLWKL